MPEENQVNIIDSGDLEIDIIDDTPPEDRTKRKAEEEPEAQIPEDDEISSYGRTCKSASNKLKYEFHEERRAKEEAARLREEAVGYAQKIKKITIACAKQLKKANVLVEQAKGRVDAQINRPKKNIQEAYESGDPDKLIEANKS